METKGLRVCNLDCIFQQEGVCIAELTLEGINQYDCKAKTNDDLVCENCGKKKCKCGESF